MPSLTQKDKKTLQIVSSFLGVTYKSLYSLIKFESGFDPFAKNPRSSARGLIQFIDATARNLGYKNSLDLVNKNPTIESQLLGPVFLYLKQFKPFKNDQSLFLSVFYPRARNWPSFKLFPENVRKSNPGINTPGDYVRKVYRLQGLTYIPPILILIGIGLLYITSKSRKGGIYGTKKKGSIRSK